MVTPNLAPESFLNPRCVCTLGVIVRRTLFIPDDLYTLLQRMRGAWIGNTGKDITVTQWLNGLIARGLTDLLNAEPQMKDSFMSNFLFSEDLSGESVSDDFQDKLLRQFNRAWPQIEEALRRSQPQPREQR